mmetsp:Transcript_28852/g.61409  ORF Transcript_28852/g.61409 Transcript_28852/m.61409 type:complete len:102 (+) Transcript_28852:118-423(+)
MAALDQVNCHPKKHLPGKTSREAALCRQDLAKEPPNPLQLMASSTTRTRQLTRQNASGVLKLRDWGRPKASIQQLRQHQYFGKELTCRMFLPSKMERRKLR